MKWCAAGLLAVAAAGCGAGRQAASEAPQEWIEPATGMAFVRIPAGRFTMGSPLSEPGREEQERQHEVALSRPFYLGRYEVTQGEWQTVQGENPSWFPGNPSMPVERVNWFEVQQFLERLTDRSDDSRFRLPSEAEWEYACRAGATTAYPGGATLTTQQANVDGRLQSGPPVEPVFRGKPTPVGDFPANAWGLHDMTGNVWEWTSDEHCEYGDGPVVDPAVTCRARLKVIRGGSWYFGADSARCALRYTHNPSDRGFSLGFRVVREEK